MTDEHAAVCQDPEYHETNKPRNIGEQIADNFQYDWQPYWDSELMRVIPKSGPCVISVTCLRTARSSTLC